MFTPGDTVICVNAAHHPADQRPLPIYAGKEYTVFAVKQCSCGAVFIDVGYRLQFPFAIVCNCQNRLADGNWWMSDQRFNKIGGMPGETLEITVTETFTRSVTIKIHR